jgi:hypothetical protein
MTRLPGLGGAARGARLPWGAARANIAEGYDPRHTFGCGSCFTGSPEAFTCCEPRRTEQVNAMERG